MTGDRTFKALEDAEAYLSKGARGRKAGEVSSSHVPASEKARIMRELKELRSRLDLSQREFAGRFGFSLANVRNWEQEDRGVPDASSRLLIEMIKVDPSTVEELVRRTRGADTKPFRSTGRHHRSNDGNARRASASVSASSLA